MVASPGPADVSIYMFVCQECVCARVCHQVDVTHVFGRGLTLKITTWTHQHYVLPPPMAIGPHFGENGSRWGGERQRVLAATRHRELLRAVLASRLSLLSSACVQTSSSPKQPSTTHHAPTSGNATANIWVRTPWHQTLAVPLSAATVGVRRSEPPTAAAAATSPAHDPSTHRPADAPNHRH